MQRNSPVKLSCDMQIDAGGRFVTAEAVINNFWYREEFAAVDGNQPFAVGNVARTIKFGKMIVSKLSYDLFGISSLADRLLSP